MPNAKPVRVEDPLVSVIRLRNQLRDLTSNVRECMDGLERLKGLRGIIESGYVFSAEAEKAVAHLDRDIAAFRR